jgi:hypothetical protein
MSKKDKPLPKPPSTPFGRKRSFEEGSEKEPLMADQMAMAMSEGKLDEFIQKKLPDSEPARKLAEMMMGMTGMMPEGSSFQPSPKKKESSKKSEAGVLEEAPSAGGPPEEVFNAVKNADVKGLMDLLRKEQKKRQGGTEDPVEGENKESDFSQSDAAIEKEILDQIIKIASENNLSLDWIFFRALKRYVHEYKKTGNL